MTTDEDTSKPKSPDKQSQASAREQRLASQLRTNLRKRKSPTSDRERRAARPRSVD